MSYKVHSQQTAKDLARVEADVLASVRQVLGQLAAFADAKAKATTVFKDRTGKLRGSIKRGQKAVWRHFVQAGGRKAPYAVYIESGSRPHEIRARRRKFLRFEVGGQVVFRKRVWHPGTKPGRFMQSARDDAEDLTLRYLEPALNAAIGRG